MTFDESYINILKEIIDKGVEKVNPRTKVKTFSIFNRQVVYENHHSDFYIPITNTRKVQWKGALIEIMWLMGMHMRDEKYAKLPITNVQYLRDNGVRYWNPWADINGNLGRVYGAQLTDWRSKDGVVNQLENIIDKLRNNPDDRRLVMTMWNPAELGEMILPPCHHTIEFYSEPLKNGQRKLHTRWMQRSADMPIGVPYNILMYVFMNRIVAYCTGHLPGNVYGLLGDCHVYENQLEEVKEIIRRWDRGEVQKCTNPILEMSYEFKDLLYSKNRVNLNDFKLDGTDFCVFNYNPCPKLNIAVTA